jgi:hypothetical protein
MGIVDKEQFFHLGPPWEKSFFAIIVLFSEKGKREWGCFGGRNLIECVKRGAGKWRKGTRPP